MAQLVWPLTDAFMTEGVTMLPQTDAEIADEISACIARIPWRFFPGDHDMQWTVSQYIETFGIIHTISFITEILRGIVDPSLAQPITTNDLHVMQMGLFNHSPLGLARIVAHEYVRLDAEGRANALTADMNTLARNMEVMNWHWYLEAFHLQVAHLPRFQGINNHLSGLNLKDAELEALKRKVARAEQRGEVPNPEWTERLQWLQVYLDVNASDAEVQDVLAHYQEILEVIMQARTTRDFFRTARDVGDAYRAWYARRREQQGAPPADEPAAEEDAEEVAGENAEEDDEEDAEEVWEDEDEEDAEDV